MTAVSTALAGILSIGAMNCLCTINVVYSTVSIAAGWGQSTALHMSITQLAHDRSSDYCSGEKQALVCVDVNRAGLYDSRLGGWQGLSHT